MIFQGTSKEKEKGVRDTQQQRNAVHAKPPLRYLQPFGVICVNFLQIIGRQETVNQGAVLLPSEDPLRFMQGLQLLNTAELVQISRGFQSLLGK